MHPILASGRRLVLYLLAWLPVLALLVYVGGAAGGGIAWRDTALVLAPVCFVYAFVCLSPWYVCRAIPLRPASMTHAVITCCAAAAVCSAFFVACARAAAYAFAAQPPPEGRLPLLFGMGVLLYLLSTGLHYAALANLEQREAERRAAEARTLARESELQALRFQLNPHFLFNSLHSIAALATLDGARARQMCVLLSDFLRSSLAISDRDSISLRDELALARSYLDVEHVRFGARLRIEETIEKSCEECLVPALLLQPLVENAVKHGVASLVDGGAIRLAVSRSGGRVAIQIENAFDPEMSNARPGGPVHGLGLGHVRRRLQVRYGEEAELECGPTTAGAIYRVVLRMPCESPIASSNRA
jgi:two-component sensor histidine kinase